MARIRVMRGGNEVVKGQSSNGRLDLELSGWVAKRIRARARRCWQNATCGVGLLGPGARYVEGWVVVNGGNPTVIEHGWCEAGKAIVDPSYAPNITQTHPPLSYWPGMRFTAKEAEAALGKGKLPLNWSREDHGNRYRRAFVTAWKDAYGRLPPEPLGTTRVVNCRIEPFDILVGRPSRWSNPFHIGPDGTREQVTAKFREWFIRQPRLLGDVRALHGKVLGCDCPPRRCHGEILAELADMGRYNEMPPSFAPGAPKIRWAG
jgi:hypothetical protein